MRITRSTAAAFASVALVALVARAGGAQTPAPAPAQGDQYSAAFKKLGVFPYPAKGQSAAVQSKDAQECYTWAAEQTGFDPMTTAAPNADSAAKAAQAQTKQATQGAAVKGAAKGAAAGALIGAASGDAGKGAAIGASVGGVGGRMGKKGAEREAAAAGGNAAVASHGQQIDTFKKAAGTCLESRGYTLSK